MSDIDDSNKYESLLVSITVFIIVKEKKDPVGLFIKGTIDFEYSLICQKAMICTRLSDFRKKS